MLLGYCCCRGEKCGDCQGCCTGAVPNSLDITFGVGWSDPTIDEGKCGCQGVHTDDCADLLDGQTFNLAKDYSPHNCWSLPFPSDDCRYGYEQTGWCNVGGGEPSPDMLMSLYAYFTCSGSSCLIHVQMRLCAFCDPGGRSLTIYNWLTPVFSPRNCSSGSWTANWNGLFNFFFVDPEGFCVRPAVLGDRALTIEDGG